MKDKIKYLTLNEVKQMVDQPISVIEQQIKGEREKIPAYIRMILAGAGSDAFAAAMIETQSRIRSNQQANPDGVVAQTAGAYFANENVIAGSMVSTGIGITNRNGQEQVPGWEDRGYKIKLGPGITFITPTQLYSDLLAKGATKPELLLNYAGPFGTDATRQGIADIVNARLNDEVGNYSASEVVQTTGCTEAIELALEAISQIRPGSEILSAGFSYYTALFTAEQKGLRVKRVMPTQLSNDPEVQFRSVASEIADTLTPQTSAILLTSPNNPTGETYTSEELKSIIELAVKNDIYILFDAIFEEMEFSENINGSFFLNLARDMGALDKVIVMDSLAKRRGLAGVRFGWLVSQDEKILEVIENSLLARRCNSTLPFEPLAQFEGVFSLLAKEQRYNGNSSLPAYAQQLTTERNLDVSARQLLELFTDWDDWRRSSQEYYQQNLAIMQLVLDEFALGNSANQVAFNAFVKMGENISPTDFMTKLMLLTGTYTQVGPCFGIAEKIWRDQLGLWARVSYATEREDLIAGLTRMIALATAYQELDLGDNTQYPTLDISYDSQV